MPVFQEETVRLLQNAAYQKAGQRWWKGLACLAALMNFPLLVLWPVCRVRRGVSLLLVLLCVPAQRDSTAQEERRLAPFVRSPRQQLLRVPLP